MHGHNLDCVAVNTSFRVKLLILKALNHAATASHDINNIGGCDLTCCTDGK